MDLQNSITCEVSAESVDSLIYPNRKKAKSSHSHQTGYKNIAPVPCIRADARCQSEPLLVVITVSSGFVCVRACVVVGRKGKAFVSPVLT